MRQRKLTEARNDIMTQEEINLFYNLLDLLDSKGHSKYADRLEAYDLHIVPIKEDPNFTAAIANDPTTPIIYIGEGFLTDKQLFEQLDPIMRHELAHQLMKHEIRMIRKMNAMNSGSTNDYEELMHSRSFHDLLNIIMDDEISNTRYTKKDKQLLRNLILNGVSIRGLVTEDHEPDWQTLTLEQMFEKALVQLDASKKAIITKSFAPRRIKQKIGNDLVHPIDGTAADMFKYVDIDSPTGIFGTTFANDVNKSADKILKSNAYKTCSLEIKVFIKSLVNSLRTVSGDKLKKVLKAIQKTSVMDKVRIGETALNTPEEKYICVCIIKALLGNTLAKPEINVSRVYHDVDYITAYTDTITGGAKSSLTAKDLEEILDIIADMHVYPGDTHFGEISEEDYKDQEYLRKKAGLSH